MKKIKIVFALFVLSFNVTLAQTQDSWKPVSAKDETIKTTYYRSYTSIPSLNLKNPTVVDVWFDGNVQLNDATIFDNTKKEFIYSIVLDTNKGAPYITGIEDKNNKNYTSLYDRSYLTSNDFNLDGKAKNTVVFTVYFNEPIKSDWLTISLDKNVNLPTSITVQPYVNNKYINVLNNVRPYSQTVNFPATKASIWVVTISYEQQLRITEISFRDTENIISKKTVRFLASPEDEYTLYASQDGRGTSYFGNNVQNLNYAPQAKQIGPLTLKSNSSYIPLDTDKDGIYDDKDNCKTIPNIDQKDTNSNGVGDPCDDDDLDGVVNSIDNCPNITNRDQADTDGDKIGNACDYDESRLTEKYPVVIWVVLGLAGLVFIVLLYIVSLKMKRQIGATSNSNDNINNNPPTPPIQN